MCSSDLVAQNQALKQAAAGAPDAAPPEAQQAQQDSGSDYNAGLAQATQLYKTNDFAKAYAECVRISGIDPSRWEGYYIAGLSAEALNDPQNAHTAFQYAYAQAPDAAKQTISQRVNAMQGSSSQAN